GLRGGEAQAHGDVGLARARVRLYRRRVELVDRIEEVQLLDAGRVALLIDDLAGVGREPPAGEAVQLLLGDELGLRVLDLAARAAGHLHRRGLAARGHDPQLARAHEAQ